MQQFIMTQNRSSSRWRRSMFSILILLSIETARGFHIAIRRSHDFTQLRSSPQSSSSSREITALPSSYNDHLSNNNSDKNQVKWLIRSTELVLGDKSGWLTPQSTSQYEEQSSLLSQFASRREYIIQAESIMKSWVNWISKQPDCHHPVVTSIDSNDISSLTSGEGAQIVENILKQTLNIYNEWEELNVQNKNSYLTTTRTDLINIAISAWIRRKSRDSVDSAVRLLHSLQKKKNGLILTYANEESYHLLIKACISSRTPQNLVKAISLFDEISSVRTICPTHNLGYDNKDTCRLYPTAQTYNLILYGLANGRPNVNNAQRAEQLLQQMIDSQNSHGCRPDSNSFRQVVSAWTKSGSKKAVENAQRILDTMLTDYSTILPDASTYNAIMTLYLRNGNPANVLDLFDQMLAHGRTKLDSCTVNLMLRAKSYKPRELSMDEMNEIETSLMNMESLYQVRPTTQSYNVIIDAWAKSPLLGAVDRAEALLDVMEQNCKNGDMTAIPDAYTITSLMNAISRADHGAKGSRAEKVFRRMKRLNEIGIGEAPTTPVYNALLNALITCNEKGAYIKARSLFAEMQAENIANTRSYNIMIKSHSTIVENANGILSFAKPSKAKALLYQMEQSRGSRQPDSYSYTTVIYAYSRSNVKRKAIKAYGILRKAINSEIRPPIYAFNGVLAACANSYLKEEKVQAFTILVSTLLMIREWSKPDDSTYKVLIKACERLLPSDEMRKKQVVELVFRELEFQIGDPKLHASMMNKFMNMDGKDEGPSELFLSPHEP